MKAFEHCTVLLEETVNLLVEKLDLERAAEPLIFADCTLGGAGHTLHLLNTLCERLKASNHDQVRVELLCCDQDPTAISVAQERIQNWRNLVGASSQNFSVEFLQTNFRNLPDWLREHKPNRRINGLMADLGVSSPQLDEAERGFSFLRDGPLDMRMNTEANVTAEELLKTSSEKELDRIFQTFGEEPRSRALAKAIVKDRQSGDVPLSNTVAFAQYVERVLGYHQSRVHPATRVFQALRIAVNQELAAVEELLKELPQIMAAKSSVAIISFHSLEDRLVKQHFRAWETGSVTPEDKKAQEKQNWLESQMGLIHSHGTHVRSFGQEVPRGGTTASPDEIKRNPRARSARLRGFRFGSELPMPSASK